MAKQTTHWEKNWSSKLISSRYIKKLNGVERPICSQVQLNFFVFHFLLSIQVCARIPKNVGNENITQETNAKLLGVTIDDNQKWHTQIYGKGGLLSSLNSRPS